MRADRLALTAVLIALAGLANDLGSPFGKANRALIEEGGVTVITYTDGQELVAVTPDGVTVSTEIARLMPPPMPPVARPAPPPTGDFVRDADIIVEPDGVFAVLTDLGPTRYAIVDRRTGNDDAWQNGARYTLVGSVLRNRGLTVGIEVREAFKLAG